jgi:O-antigen/teichoic acid export membrane protein
MSSDGLSEEGATLVAEPPLSVPEIASVEVPAPTQRTTVTDEHGAALKSDIATSIRNAAKLGGSLLGTWAVALAVRVFLPRHLGPESFGAYQFADAFTTVTLIATTLGVETYIRKEVPPRPQHASDFFGGTALVCGLLGVLVLVASLVGLDLAGKSTGVIWLVGVLGVATMLVNLNINVAAVIHTVGKVDGLSVLNVVSKLLWGGGIALALALGGGVHAVAAAVLGSEVVRTIGLAALARRAASLRWRVDFGATRAVLFASLPFYIGALAQTVYSKLDTSIMAFLASDTEVGWYGASQTVVGLALILTPLIGWVLLPLAARAVARSHDELRKIGAQSLVMVSMLSFPVTLLLSLNADLAIRVMFGVAYAPAAQSLRILAPLFVLSYWAMVTATLLIQLGRGWTVTAVTVSGMVTAALLNLLLVPRTLAAFGAGGAGIGAGVSLLITEVLTTAVLCWLVGRGVVTRGLLATVGKTIVVCAAVAVAHVLIGELLVPAGAPAGLAAWTRLGVDIALYCGLILAVGAVNVAQLRTMLGHLKSRRGGAPEPA